jgi:glycogen debranching enzyme
MQNTITNKAHKKALEVLKSCAKPQGFHASGLPGGYEAVWARDSITTTLGACFHEEFKDTIKKSIELLSDNQSKYGLIPNCVGSYNNDRQSDVTFNSIDAPLWYIIGHYVYVTRYKDTSLISKYKNNLKKALFWLKCQDPDNIGLIAQQPTADWQDAFPHKYGYTIHCNALYYAALKFMGEDKEAENLKKIINGEYRAYSSLFDKKLGYYFPWGWKNHDTDREHEEWFDTGGNLLAIITGLATPAIAKSILYYIEKNKINKPYPCKVTWPPMKKGDKTWHSYFELCNAKNSYQYLNAGIWPFIGGLYIVALIKTGQFAKAKIELENLAKADLQIIKEPGSPEYLNETAETKKIRQKEFNEWLDGKTGLPKGEPYQAWSAGTYLYAFECLKAKKVLFF